MENNQNRRRQWIDVLGLGKWDYNDAVQVINLILPYLFWTLYVIVLHTASVQLLPLYKQHLNIGHDQSFGNHLKFQTGCREGWAMDTIIQTLGPGEDASIQCPCLSVDTILDISWYMNGMPLQYSWRHKRSTELPTMYELLEISFIQESDYGVYTCYVQLIATSSEDAINYTTKASTILEPRSASNVIVRLPVGGVFVHILFYRVYDNSVYVHSILVNNRSYRATCGVAYSGCSWFVSIFMQFLSALKVEMPNRNIVRKEQINIINTVWESSTLFMCVCPSAYGNITALLSRIFYNSTSSRIEVFPMLSHTTYTLLPRRSPFFTWGSDDVNSSNNLQPSINGVWLDIKKDDMKVFGVVEILVLLIFTSFLAYVCFHILKKVLIWTLVQLPWGMYYERHKVFIVCSHNDEQWTEQVLNPCIRFLGHTTYIHNRDSNCGGYEMQGINRGFDTCNRFMILESDSSVSAHPWEFQVQLVSSQLISISISAFQVMVVSLCSVNCSSVNDITRISGTTHFKWSETNIQRNSKKNKQSKKKCTRESKRYSTKLKLKLSKALHDWLHPASLIKDLFEKKMQHFPLYQAVFIWIVDSVLIYFSFLHFGPSHNIIFVPAVPAVLTVLGFYMLQYSKKIIHKFYKRLLQC